MAKSKSTEKRPVFVLVVAFAAVVAGALFVLYSQSNAGGPISTITGELKCLPHKGVDGAQTAECRTGILLDDGETYYEVRDASVDKEIVNDLPFRRQVTLTGKLDSNKKTKQYSTKGTFEVTKAKLVDQ